MVTSFGTPGSNVRQLPGLLDGRQRALRITTWWRNFLAAGGPSIMESSLKCLRCSARFLNGDVAVFDHGQWIHARCLKIMTGAEQVGKAQGVVARAKEVAAETQEHLLRAREIIEKPVTCLVCHGPLTPAELVIAKEGLVHRACIPETSEPESNPLR